MFNPPEADKDSSKLEKNQILLKTDDIYRNNKLSNDQSTNYRIVTVQLSLDRIIVLTGELYDEFKE